MGEEGIIFHSDLGRPDKVKPAAVLATLRASILNDPQKEVAYHSLILSHAPEVDASTVPDRALSARCLGPNDPGRGGEQVPGSRGRRGVRDRYPRLARAQDGSPLSAPVAGLQSSRPLVCRVSLWSRSVGPRGDREGGRTRCSRPWRQRISVEQELVSSRRSMRPQASSGVPNGCRVISTFHVMNAATSTRALWPTAGAERTRRGSSRQRSCSIPESIGLRRASPRGQPLGVLLGHGQRWRDRRAYRIVVA